jgi:hypothetical protein
MIRTLATFLFACALPTAAAQDLPGVRTTLRAEPAMVSGGEVSLKLGIEVTQDAEVPAALLTGVQLDCTVGGDAGPKVREGGAAGMVALAAGTRIERAIRVAVATIAPQAKDATGVLSVALAWPILP